MRALLPPLRAAPATLPALAAVGVLAWWMLDAGGFAVRLWAPGGLALIGLLAVAVLAAPAPWATLPRTVLLATACLVAFTLWSLASVLWADDPGYAWEGAGRTLVYLVVFCLFALWPQAERTAAWLLGALLAAVALAAAVTLVRLTGDPTAVKLLGSGRLQAPTGYPNATACLMLMGLLPAVVLAASPAVRWWLRGALVALAVLLAGPALLAVSRGAIYATPVVVLLLLVAVPGRVRMVLVLLAVGGGAALAARSLVDVSDVVNAGGDVPAAVNSALKRLLGGAVLAGALTALAAWLPARAASTPGKARRLERGLQAVVVAVLVVGVLGGAVVAGNPADRVRNAWHSFKGGYEDNAAGKNRLVAGLGSNRYDFYRVGLRSFRDHPIAGVGADGFYQQYLRDGKSFETPRYPHSLEVRTLAQTGVIGAVLLLGFLVAAALAALRAMRAGGPLQGAVAGGAAIGATYWVAHGSLDWFWEWAGLGAPAFALAGLACALTPRGTVTAHDDVAADDPRRDGAPAPAAAAALRTVPRGVLLRLGVVTLAVLAALPLLSLWTSDAERTRAGAQFATRPGEAYARLDRAASLNPFSSAPATLEGSVAVRLGDLPRADAAFGRALARVPGDQYATLLRGAVASARGDQPRALALLQRAVVLAPMDGLAQEARDVVRSGGAVDVQELTRRIFTSARRLIA